MLMLLYTITRLYTNIPHNLLKDQMKFLVDEAFGIKSDKSYIKLNKSSATWADKIPKKKLKLHFLVKTI